MTPDDWDHQMSNHATAIGFVCIKWSWLELILDCYVAQLCGLDIGSIESQVLTPNMDIRAKVTTVRALGREKRLSDDWFAELDKVLVKIDDDIRLKRNRVVHDIWSPPTGARTQPYRTYARTKVIRTQSFQSPKLTTHEKVEMSALEIIAIANEITKAVNQLLDLAKMMPTWPNITD